MNNQIEVLITNQQYVRQVRGVHYIQPEDLEALAQRVWDAPEASLVNGNEKYVPFGVMGFATMSTEFPYGMRQGDWVQVGDLEISYSHGRRGIPGYIRVRPTSDQPALYDLQTPAERIDDSLYRNEE